MWKHPEVNFSFIFFKDGNLIHKGEISGKFFEINGEYKFIDKKLIRIEYNKMEAIKTGLPYLMTSHVFGITIHGDKLIISDPKSKEPRQIPLTKVR